MKSRTTRQFWQLFDALPKDAQDQATTAFALWQVDPWHNSLRFKKVETSIPLFSVRVGLNYRAVGKREGDMIRWFWIGPHGDYEKLIR